MKRMETSFREFLRRQLLLISKIASQMKKGVTDGNESSGLDKGRAEHVRDESPNMEVL